MEEFLRGYLPRLLGEKIAYFIYVFRGKGDLLRNLTNRLQGYRSWIAPDHVVVVLVDRDDDDCMELKARLEHCAAAAKMPTWSRPHDDDFFVLNRIVIEELEAWYFGDWEAIQAAYPRVPASIPETSRYRDPDAIKGGTWEAFQRVMQNAGYFKTGLRKIEAAREISPHMEPSRSTSKSFQVFRDALLGLRS